MAGTLTLDTLKTSSGVFATQNGITGIAKAWVRFSGSTPTINSSYNVTSITKNGTGDYTINFTVNMTDTNFAAAGLCGYYGAAAGYMTWTGGGTDTVSTNNIKVQAYNSSGSVTDMTKCAIVVFGN